MRCKANCLHQLLCFSMDVFQEAARYIWSHLSLIVCWNYLRKKELTTRGLVLQVLVECLWWGLEQGQEHERVLTSPDALMLQEHSSLALESLTLLQQHCSAAASDVTLCEILWDNKRFNSGAWRRQTPACKLVVRAAFVRRHVVVVAAETPAAVPDGDHLPIAAAAA